MTSSAQFRRLLARLAAGALVMALAFGAAISRTRAQVEVGAICVATFADLNGDGLRGEGEPPLAGVTVNLSTGGEVIATHVMAEGEAQYCFERLLTGAYTITFVDSPAYATTTANEGTFNLDPGQRLTITDFGATPLVMTDQPAETGAVVLETAPFVEEPIDPTLRLLLSTVGAVGMMIFMIGLGAIVLGVRGLDPRRRPRRASRTPKGSPPPPAHIEPPRV